MSAFRLLLWWVACFCAGRYLAIAWHADASLVLPIGFCCAVFGLYRESDAPPPKAKRGS